MPDLRLRLVRPGGTVSVVMPRVDIDVQVLDSRTGAVQRDFSGANALPLWSTLRTLLQDAANREEFEDIVTAWIVRKRAES